MLVSARTELFVDALNILDALGLEYDALMKEYPEKAEHFNAIAGMVTSLRSDIAEDASFCVSDKLTNESNISEL